MKNFSLFLLLFSSSIFAGPELNRHNFVRTQVTCSPIKMNIPNQEMSILELGQDHGFNSGENLSGTFTALSSTTPIVVENLRVSVEQRTLVDTFHKRSCGLAGCTDVTNSVFAVKVKLEADTPIALQVDGCIANHVNYATRYTTCTQQEFSSLMRVVAE